MKKKMKVPPPPLGEKSVARDHRLSSIGNLVVTNGDPERRIFLSYPHMNNGLFLNQERGLPSPW